MLTLLAVLAAPLLPTPPAEVTCPPTIHLGQDWSAADDRLTTGLHDGCARRHGGDKNWCAKSITKAGEINYRVICAEVKK